MELWQQYAVAGVGALGLAVALTLFIILGRDFDKQPKEPEKEGFHID